MPLVAIKKRPPYQNQQNICIKETDHIRYLGVEVDRYLKWDKHINILIKKLRSILYKFKILGSIICLKHLNTVYYSLVYSVLQYGMCVWGSAYKTHLDKLAIVQKLFIKNMMKKKRDYPSDALYQESQLLDVNQIFCFKVLTHQYKNKDQLQKINHEHYTRHKINKQTKTLKAKKTIGQRSFYFLAPHMYVRIPEDIRNENRKIKFKSLLKAYWIWSLPRIKARQFIDLT